ncbi:MAG: hypothetical protein ACM3TR_11870 [Caulobacteraceae bacterium]
MITRKSIIILLFLFIMSTYVCAEDSSSLSLDKDLYEGLGAHMKITFTSPTLNRDPRTPETTIAHITTSENDKGIDVILSETGKNTGIFSNSIGFSLTITNESKGVIKVKTNTVINVECNGSVASAAWIPYDGKISLDSTKYSGLGARPKVTMTDFDLNLEPNTIEEIDVHVTSDTDAKGINLRLKETKCNSGIFTGDFGLTEGISDEEKQILHIEYNNKIYAAYMDKTNTKGEAEISTKGSVWTPETAKLSLGKSAYSGLNSKCKITVDDNDMNLRHDNKDALFVKVTSDADSKGFYMKLYETSQNTGIFSGDLKFSINDTYKDWGIIKVGQKSKITVAYIDDCNASNEKSKRLEQAAQFQLAEAKISTSAEEKKGLSGYLTITITEPDADISNTKNTIPVNITSNTSPEGLVLWLEETGSSTGIFKGTLYCSDKKVTDKKKKDVTILISYGDVLDITYNDTTLPEGKSKELKKSIPCVYDQASISLDKKVYTGYNSAAAIKVHDSEANRNSRTVEHIKVHVSSGTNPSGFNITLDETGNDTGEFKGVIHFGKATNQTSKILSVATGDIITASYDSQGEVNSGTITATAYWEAHNAELKLNQAVYYGNDSEMRITLKDYDADNNPKLKDRVTALAGIKNKAGSVKVILTETGNNTCVFTCSVIINSTKKGEVFTIKAEDGDILEVRYTDEVTKENKSIEQKACASWNTVKP